MLSESQIETIIAGMRPLLEALEALEAPKPEKWAKEKAAFAEGKVIEWRHPGWPESLPWRETTDPFWYSFNEYRIKPDPEQAFEEWFKTASLREVAEMAWTAARKSA